MNKYRLAVCKGPDCRRNGSEAVYMAARKAVLEGNLSARCEVYRGGCYGLCHLGPNVVVREDQGQPRDRFSREDFQLMGWAHEWYYWAMTPEKLQQIIESHVLRGQVVTELLGDPSKEEDFRNQAQKAP